MSKNLLTRCLVNRTPARVALIARVLVPACILLVATLFPCATPSFGLLNLTESEAPVDQDESSAKEAINIQIRTRVVVNQPSSPLLVPAPGGLRSATANIASLPHSGHRLANHLLAPLRC